MTSSDKFIPTQKSIRELPLSPNSYKKGCGEGLYVEVRDKGKYFKAKYRGSESYIGKFGKGHGEISLEEALKKWRVIKDWSKETSNKVGTYNLHMKKERIRRSYNLDDAVKGFLEEHKSKVKPTSYKENARKLNQILSLVSPYTPLNELYFDGEGRETIMNVIEEIRGETKHDMAIRSQQLLSQVFNFSIRKGWMKQGQNPAVLMDGDEIPYRSTPHPTVSWNEVPQLIKDINLNRINSHKQSVYSTKMLLMTGLRTGTLVRLEWDWITTVNGVECIEIPGDTYGLKRRFFENDNIPHHIPLTPQIEKLLDVCRNFVGEDGKYVFQPLRQNRYPHLDPEAPNNYFKRLGYKGRQTAHGWRRTILTAGQEVLKENSDIIQRQMCHLLGDKVRRAYDESLMLDERKRYLEKWCNLLVDLGLEISV